MGWSLEDGAFRQAALACLDGLYGFALSLARDPSLAEDLVQETYVRALAARRKAAPGENLRGWLFVILRNVWRNEVRRRRQGREEGEAEPDSLVATDPDPFALLERHQTGSRLRDAMDALPEAFREVLVLRCVEGLSYQEIAAVVGCPAGTVMSRLARARAVLRRSLGPALALVAKRGDSA